MIGVTAYEEVATWQDEAGTAALLPSSYVDAVHASGGIAVVVPVQELGPGDARRLLGRLDGLIVSGGPDLSPLRYGAPAHPATSDLTPSRIRRDDLEVRLFEAADESAMPMLAICRGMQLVNVARGGSLHQHLPDVIGHEAHEGKGGAFGLHDVSIEGSSRLAELLPWSRSLVPTYHHQGVDALGDGLVAVARADDGTIEAIEDPSRPLMVAVQWHPEAGSDPSLFEALVAAAGS